MNVAVAGPARNVLVALVNNTDLQSGDQDRAIGGVRVLEDVLWRRYNEAASR